MLKVHKPVGAVVPTQAATSVARPLNAADVTITGGFWADRIRLNRERTLVHGFEWLERVGTLANFRLAAGAHGKYQALGEPQGIVLPFLDSDAYKWLEAVGWELGRAHEPGLASAADEAIALVGAAQRPDGYLNTYVQVVTPGQEYRDLAWGHELYCIGHLVQAAIAWHRAVGDDRLLDVALRAVDNVDRELGAEGREGIDGHPEIEVALVELYRVSGDRRHLDLAARMIDSRGRGLLGAGRNGAAYWQDHLPASEAPTVAGHAVRQLYLDAGIVDLATELGDDHLLDVVRRRWDDMVATRMYLTGGLGSRHRDEAFGDPFELPPDRAYAETCASIASVMLAWRLLLATGEPRYGDVLERTMFNGVLSGISLSGDRFYYTNPLQRRTHRAAEDENGERTPWNVCACCPPNLMRLLSSWEQYLASATDDGVQIHQYATAEISVTALDGGPAIRLAVETDYPWSGRVTVTAQSVPDDPWTLALRVPAWARAASMEVAGEGRTNVEPGTVAIQRRWQAGDQVALDLDLAPRVVEPDERIDAVRGCVALERGPLVYAIESADLPAGVELEDVRLPADVRPMPVARDDVAAHVVGLDVPTDTMTVRAIPYFAWANRTPGAMRVWIPRAR